MKTEVKEKKERVTWGDVFPKSRISMLDNGRIKKMRVEGARKLLLCIDKEVKILLSEEILHIEGGGLVCNGYASGAIEVSGEIVRIFFETRIGVREGRA